jgi:hypothetical protein
MGENKAFASKEWGVGLVMGDIQFDSWQERNGGKVRGAWILDYNRGDQLRVGMGMKLEMEAETFGHHDCDSASDFKIKGIFWGMRLSIKLYRKVKWRTEKWRTKKRQRRAQQANGEDNLDLLYWMNEQNYIEEYIYIQSIKHVCFN